MVLALAQLLSSRSVLKFLLLSVLIATFVAPALTAGAKNPRRALRFLVLAMSLVELGYAFFLRFLYERML